MKKTIGCTVAIILAICVAWVAFANSPSYQLFQHSFVVEKTTFSIPGSSLNIEHSRIGTHGLVAEYDRWLTVVDEHRSYQKQKMVIDTCGGYPIDCYLIQDGQKVFLRLDDAVSAHIVDLGDGVIVSSGFDKTALGANANLGEYIGTLDGKTGKLKFDPVSIPNAAPELDLGNPND